VVNAFVKISAALLDASRDFTIVTPNERLARELRRGLNQAHQARGLEAWPSPHCLSLNQLLQQHFATWQDYTDTAMRLLTNSQLLSRFYQCANPSNRHLSPSAAQALDLLYRYDIEIDALADGSEGGELFVPWARAVLELSQPDEIYIGQLAKTLLQQAKPPTKPLLLLAFDHLSVTERRYLEACNDASGVKWLKDSEHILDFATIELGQHPPQPRTPRQQPRLFAFDSIATELAAAARWSADVCRQQPNARVAVVVPKLAQIYHRVQRQFSVTFDPEAGSATRCFDLSGGSPLADQPAWLHASVLLNWCHTPITKEALESLSFSPFVTAPWCITSLHSWPSEQRVIDISSVADDSTANTLLQHLEHAPTSERFTYWLTFIDELLRQVNWPNLSELESGQFQAVTQIQQSMTELGREQMADDQFISFEAALELLTLHLQSKMFAPQRPASQVQVLGLLETTGFDYSHLWVCGMDANSFPQTASLNPFIPTAVARQHKLPRVTPDQELEFAQRTLNQWLNSDAELNFSYVSQLDGYELLPSQAIADIAAEATVAMLPKPEIYHPFYRRDGVQLIRTEDFKGLPVQDQRMLGGTSALQDQLECPFRAFAHQRLGLRQERDPSEFPDALERGLTLHAVMQHLAEHCKTSTHLTELTEAQIYQACTEVLQRRAPLPEAFFDNECTRLANLVRQWLDIEGQRLPFTIDAVEREFQLELAGLTFALRVDRIDNVNNRAVVLDYKSSSKSASGATKSPPTDLQLPIYSLLDEQIASVAYACISDKAVKAVGIGEQALSEAASGTLQIKPTPEPWTEQRQQWQLALVDLAQALRDGDATVTPRKGACRYCHLQGLCRINTANDEDSVHEFD
jgi:RecB family exonuclease